MSFWIHNYLRNEASKPLSTKAGIKAQTKRGAFGQSWWAKRWIAVLEGFAMGPRLTRGKTYARNGQVVSLTIDKGRVAAKVQGSRRTPYSVHIEMGTLTPDEWAKVGGALASQASFMARLLGGQMPEDIEEVFTASGLNLFPKSLREIHTNCSCPDWAVPCKHTAAVYYLLGEEFDRDPFLIFKLRGMEREELIETALGREREPDPQPVLNKARKKKEKAVPEKTLVPEPLPCDPARFWSDRTQEIRLELDLSAPASDALLPKRLGRFPLWRGQDDFLPALTPVYLKAALSGLSVIMGDLEVKRPEQG